MTAEGLQRVLAPCLERPFPGSHAGEGRVWGRLCAPGRAANGMKPACLTRLTATLSSGEKDRTPGASCGVRQGLPAARLAPFPPWPAGALPT